MKGHDKNNISSDSFREDNVDCNFVFWVNHPPIPLWLRKLRQLWGFYLKLPDIHPFLSRLAKSSYN
jgi:hypothetical protein